MRRGLTSRPRRFLNSPSMYTATADSFMNPSSPSAATTATTVPRGPPGIVTYRYQHEKGSELAYVALADSHEEAQLTATRTLAALAGVDPRWLVFTITIRYRRTNERHEIAIAPGAWGYVTRRLVPYRLIDVRVVPPTPLSPPPPLFPSPSKKSVAPPMYTDSPPPRYSSPHKYIPLPPQDDGYGYGYGFGWHDQTGGSNTVLRGGVPQQDPSEMADQRSMGWSASSVKFTRARGGGTGLFGRFKQNIFDIFPITWDDQPQERMRRRGKGTTRRRREKEREREMMMQEQHQQASGSGHSYVPSLL